MVEGEREENRSNKEVVKSLNFYIAARVSQKEEVRRISSVLTSKGHKSLSKWIDEGNIKPYDQHPDRSEALAKECVKAIEASDIFVLVSHETGAGMYTELGVAIASNLLRDRPRIFVIGEHRTRSVFFFHPSVTRLEDFDKVLEST